MAGLFLYCNAFGETLFGKTHDQVLKMGAKRWMDYVATKPEGSTTSGMVEALSFYNEAAEARNTKLFAKTSAKRKKTLTDLEERLWSLGQAILESEYEANGGGTMFRLFYPSRRGDIIDLTYAMLTGGALSKKGASDTALMKKLDAWSKRWSKDYLDEVKPEYLEKHKKIRAQVVDCLKNLGSLKPKEKVAVRAMIGAWLRIEE